MKKLTTKQITLLGLLTAFVVIFSFTPIGSIPVGPLSITLNVIPVAIGAIALGPIGGLIMGSIFGLFSFLQCFSIGMPSSMGIILANINPFLAFIQRFVPRALDGFLVGCIFRFAKKLTGARIACFITGFFTALLNTVFFMSALVIIFGNTDYVKGLIGGRNVIVAVCAMVGFNAVFEMITTTILTGIIGIALHRAKLLDNYTK